jgi:hypothetical protein
LAAVFIGYEKGVGTSQQSRRLVRQIDDSTMIDMHLACPNPWLGRVRNDDYSSASREDGTVEKGGIRFPAAFSGMYRLGQVRGLIN